MRWAEGFSAITDRILRPRKNVPAGLVTAGGWCAPAETAFDPKSLGLRTFDVVSSEPAFSVKRGGIEYNNVTPIVEIPRAPRPFEVVGSVWSAWRDDGYEGPTLLGLVANADDARAACEDEDARLWTNRRREPIDWDSVDAEPTWQEGWSEGIRYYISTQDVTTIKKDRPATMEDSE